jgi:hypothetical protein
MPKLKKLTKSVKPAKAGKPAKTAGKIKPQPLATFSIDAKTSSVSSELSVAAEGLEPILGACYLLTDRAFAYLEGDRARKIRVTLRPKSVTAGPKELKGLGDEFVAELQTQKVRWAISRNNLPIREFIAEQAVLLANGKLPEPPAAAGAPAATEELSDEQRQEIEKLIAEVEQEIKALNDKKAPSDPKNIAASWEEKQQTAAKAKGEAA